MGLFSEFTKSFGWISVGLSITETFEVSGSRLVAREIKPRPKGSLDLVTAQLVDYVLDDFELVLVTYSCGYVWFWTRFILVPSARVDGL